MFEYSVEQKTYEIYGVKIGGVPGMSPTVMVGSMFYKGHSIVTNPKEGIFDENEAKKQLASAEEISKVVGLPSMVDLVSENASAARRYLEFVVDESKMPIMLDIVDEEEQAEALQQAHEMGIIDRIIFNSLNPETSEKIYEKISETGCTSATLLLHSTSHMLSSSKEELLEKIAPKAKLAGIKNILVDTVVIDVPTLGLAVNAICRIKDRYGYPCGCGAHNAISSWKNLRKKYTPDAVTINLGVTNSLPISAGADFVFYGPMKNADAIYPSIAMINTAYSQLVMERKMRISREHPRYRIG